MDLSEFTIEQIDWCLSENKKKIQELEKANKELEEEKIYRLHGIKIGNILKDSRGTGVVCELQEKYCKASVIKKDGEVGTKVLHMWYEDCEKLYDSYEEFKSTVDELARG